MLPSRRQHALDLFEKNKIATFGAGMNLALICDLRLAGRNLAMWTDYRGLDPEANLGGAEFLTQGIDYFNNPQTRSWVVSVNLSH